MMSNCKGNELCMFIKPIIVTHAGEMRTLVRIGTPVKILGRTAPSPKFELTILGLPGHAELVWKLSEVIKVSALWSDGCSFSGDLLGVDDSYLIPIRSTDEDEDTLTQVEDELCV